MNWKEVRNALMWMAAGSMLMFTCFWAGFHALDKEAAWQEELREHRCATWENMTEEMKRGYCEQFKETY